MSNLDRIRFRRLREPDLPLMHRWLNTDLVNRWYGKKPCSYAEVRVKYLPRINGQAPTRSFLILYGDTPIGYIQTYRLADYADYSQHLQVDEDAAGVDLFIGEREYIHRGLGSVILGAFLREIVFACEEIGCCIVGPEPKNTAAIRCYEKTGFEYLKTVCAPNEPEPEYLMRIDREGLAAAIGSGEENVLSYAGRGGKDMDENTHRLYNDLVWLWPLWGSQAEYADWCNHVIELIERYARRDVHTLLNMGCGGGKNVFSLKGRFAVTGIDISQPMLNLARELNPECTFLQADMRDRALGQEFDSILVDDAISYMVSQAELRSVFQTAYRHLSAGGVMVVSPDGTKETFQQNRTCIAYANASVKPNHVDVVFIENYYDPDPTDDHYEGTMIYLIREHGQLRVETDRHALGLFALDVWRTALRDVGFEVHEETYIENGQESVTFVCIKPSRNH